MSTAFFVVATFVIAAASLVYSLVVSEQAKNAALNVKDGDAASLSDLNVTQQSEGLVVPIVYGNARICGNTIWWNGGKYNEEQYRICVWQTLCMGTIDYGPDWTETSLQNMHAHFNLFVDEKIQLLYPGVPGTQDPSEWYERLQVSNGNANGGLAPPSDYLDLFPNRGYAATRLRGIAHVFIKWFDLDPYVTNIPTFTYRVYNALDYFWTNLGFYFNDLPHHGTHTLGANPASIIFDLLTNVQYGLGIEESNINKASFERASNYFHGQLYYLNFYINQSMSVMDIIAKIQDWCECFLVKNEDDEYELIYFQESDADNPRCIVVDEDMIDFKFRRKSWEDTFNSFTIQYTQLFLPNLTAPGAFETKTKTIKNEANIQMTGSVRNKVVNLKAFVNTNMDGIINRSNQIMKKESYPFGNGTLTLNLRFSFLRLGDVFTIDSDEYGFEAPFRVLDINVNDADKNQLDLEIVQLRELVADDIGGPPAYSGDGQRGIAETARCLATVNFEPNSPVSGTFASYIRDVAQLRAAWCPGQTNVGFLTYGTDYTIEEVYFAGYDNPFYAIHLDEALYAEEIMMNTLGLLCIDIFEPECPTPPEES